ncbi:hypothetical protein K466DRAFT_260424 [Polyporus arcularius HHB13444]|uniref:Fungal-type protein kinase domain-containing protein n=1 Tax=Polyporus arcularius HHB13444 TaxID=1314778 RepID=A0A5C3P1F9_9APHY|nr:hypothetical protein K466DRAFT_260424 [Polyporus arcularius HHB13444]
MAQAVLHTVSSGQSIVGTAEQDLESFCWVFIYVIYKYALDDTETLQIIAEEAAHEDFRDSLAREFRALFAAFSISDLIGRRETLWGNHNLLAGIPNLLAYAVHVKDDGEDLEGIVMAIWIEIQNFQPPKFIPERGLPKYRASILARMPRAVKVEQNKATHDIILDHLKVVLHGVEERRIKEEARNVARTAREMQVE